MISLYEKVIVFEKQIFIYNYYGNFIMAPLYGDQNSSPPAVVLSGIKQWSVRCCGSDIFLLRISLIFHPISHPEEIGLCKNN